MANKSGFVRLTHKEKTYRGENYESFVGTLQVGNKHFVLSINADGGQPVVKSKEYKGKDYENVFINITEFNPKAVKSGKPNKF